MKIKTHVPAIWAGLLMMILFTASLLEAAQWLKSLSGMKFQSVDKFVVGELPTGPVEGYRTIMFQKDRTFTYQQSDAVYTGRFQWDSKSGRLIAKISGGQLIKAKMDAKTKILDWDGAKYKQIVPKP